MKYSVILLPFTVAFGAASNYHVALEAKHFCNNRLAELINQPELCYSASRSSSSRTVTQKYDMFITEEGMVSVESIEEGNFKQKMVVQSRSGARRVRAIHDEEAVALDESTGPVALPAFDFDEESLEAQGWIRLGETEIDGERHESFTLSLDAPGAKNENARNLQDLGILAREWTLYMDSKNKKNPYKAVLSNNGKTHLEVSFVEFEQLNESYSIDEAQRDMMKKYHVDAGSVDSTSRVRRLRTLNQRAAAVGEMEEATEAPYETATEAPYETATEAPGETTTEFPGETTTEFPGETTESPGETTESPGETTTEFPGETTTEFPGETTTEPPTPAVSPPVYRRFSYPEGCSADSRAGDSIYCLAGEAQLESPQYLNGSMRLYDRYDNEKSVVVGLGLLFENALATELTVLADGCAAFFEQSFGPLTLGIEACASQPSPTESGANTTKEGTAELAVNGYAEAMGLKVNAISGEMVIGMSAAQDYDINVHGELNAGAGAFGIEAAIGLVTEAHTLRNSLSSWKMKMEVSAKASLFSLTFDQSWPLIDREFEL